MGLAYKIEVYVHVPTNHENSLSTNSKYMIQLVQCNAVKFWLGLKHGSSKWQLRSQILWFQKENVKILKEQAVFQTNDQMNKIFWWIRPLSPSIYLAAVTKIMFYEFYLRANSNRTNVKPRLRLQISYDHWGLSSFHPDDSSYSWEKIQGLIKTLHTRREQSVCSARKKSIVSRFISLFDDDWETSWRKFVFNNTKNTHESCLPTTATKSED
jgi:hypothetical protein